MREKNGYYWDALAWRNSRRVRLMSREARWIYRDVLDEIWINGPIPNDPDKVATILNLPADLVLQVWPEVHECLIPTRQNPDLFTSDRLDRERRKRDFFRKKKVEAGHLGGLRSGEARRAKTLEHEQDTSEANAKQNEARGSHIPKQNEANTSTSNKNINTSLEAAVVITLPLNTGPDYPITEQRILEWSALYPAVDVAQACRNMRGWLESNPEKRKTKAGILRFCNRWLANQQDKAPKSRAVSAGYNPTGVQL